MEYLPVQYNTWCLNSFEVLIRDLYTSASWHHQISTASESTDYTTHELFSKHYHPTSELVNPQVNIEQESKSDESRYGKMCDPFCLNSDNPIDCIESQCRAQMLLELPNEIGSKCYYYLKTFACFYVCWSCHTCITYLVQLSCIIRCTRHKQCWRCRQNMCTSLIYPLFILVSLFLVRHITFLMLSGRYFQHELPIHCK